MFKVQKYSDQLEKRKTQLVGLCSISDVSFASISPALARIYHLDSNKNYILTFHVDGLEDDVKYIKIYIDPTIGLIKSNFKESEVEKIIYFHQVTMEELQLNENMFIHVDKFIPLNQIPVLEKIIVSPVNKNLKFNTTYVKLFISKRSILKDNATILIPNDIILSDSNDNIKFQIFCFFKNNLRCKDIGRIDNDFTKIIVEEKEEAEDKHFWKGEQYNTLKSLLSHSLNQRVNVAKSFLIHGAGGVGKSSMIYSIAKELDVNIKTLSPSIIYSKTFHNEEGVYNLTNQLKIAESLQPCFVILDEIDVLFPDDEDTKDLLLLNELIQIFNNLDISDVSICLIGITSKMSQLDSFVKKKFEEHIFVDVPTSEERFEILKSVLNQKQYTIPFTSDNNLEETLIDLNISKFHGFVHADISLICSRSLQKARKRSILYELPLKLTIDDFEEELIGFEPYSIKQASNTLTVPQIPKVKWDDIGGLSDIKQQLNEMIVWPLKHAHVFKKMGVKPPSGILLFGPPGTGKTLLAKAVASASESNFIAINIPDLVKAEIGESEKTLSEVFRRAKLASPCVIFFDEIQAIFGDRTDSSSSEQKLISQLLLELDGLEDISTPGSVIVIAATNVPQKIDPTLMRPGRLERVVFIAPPDKEARKSIFEMTLKKMSVTSEVLRKVDYFVDKTDKYYTGADIVNLCQSAGLNALSRSLEIEHIELEDFEIALKSIRPLSDKQLEFYVEFLEKHKSNCL
ncbi:hypothetical protein ABK040_013780 [Willaertia magna]